MIIPVFDTNIVIDFFKSIDQAIGELDRYPQRVISIMTWMEAMAGCKTSQEERDAIDLMRRHFTVIALSDEIAAIAAKIRRAHRLKLPDAVIWATAMHRETLLVTRNSKDFPQGDPTIRIPYTLPSR